MLEIYLIVNQVNEKFYVGQAVRGRVKRFRRHLNDAKTGSNLPLHRAMRKYGFSRFVVSLLVTADTSEELDALEVFWIKQLRAKDPEIGYNLTEGGGGTKGHRQSSETQAKRSQSLLGKNTGKHVGEKSYRFRHDLSSEEIVEMYRSGKSAEQIGIALGTRTETIVSRLKANGVEFRSNSEAQKIRTSDPENTPNYRADISTEDMVPLFQEGWTAQDIGDKLGCSKRCVLERLRKIGLSRSPHRCNVDKTEVARRYENGDTAYEIADAFSMSAKTVYLYLKEQGVSIRPQSSVPKKALRTEKICPGCKILLPLSGYNRDKNAIDGHMAVCRGCKKTRLFNARKKIPIAA